MGGGGGIWEIPRFSGRGGGVSHAQGRIFHNIDKRRNRSRRERMRLAARPESHSRCRSVAEGDGTRQISVLSIAMQDENESMATTQEQKPD